MELIDEILMDLVLYMDKVFLCPMGEKGIENLEKIYNRKFPDYYLAYLQNSPLLIDKKRANQLKAK